MIFIMENKINAKISVIIPNFNGEAFLKNCLNSLENQTYQNFNVIVVDDSSKDKSLELLKHYSGIKILKNPKNFGFAISVNNGIRAADGDYCILLNNDVVVTETFVETLYQAINKDKKIFSISSKMIRYYERDKIDDTGDFYNLFGWAYKRGDGKSALKMTKPTSVFSACAGAGIYRLKVFEEIGFFDEQYFAYLEDVDVSYRARVYGYKNRYEPNAICYHIGSATTAEGNKYSEFKVKISARNNIYTAYKNMPFLQLVFNFVFLACGFLIKGLMFSGIGYGKTYWKGIKEGIKTLDKVQKTPFKWQNTLNYFKIEGMLIQNVFRYLYEKITK